jgi:hypothetical protein
MPNKLEPALEYTFPGARGICGFCGQEENGYAKRDAEGAWQAACWVCVRPAVRAKQEKRAFVGTVYTEVDAEEFEKPKKKNPGLAPSGHRPKVN